MRKIVFIVLLVLPVLASGQRFKGGALVGLNVSQIDGDALSGYHKAGLMAGAYVFTEFVDKWGGQLELKYSSKGASTSKNNVQNFKVRLSYIDLPIIASYEIVENLKAELGISLNYMFQAQQYDAVWEDMQTPPNSFESAMLAGVNWRFFEKFDLNIRFSYSLFPIASTTSNATWSDGAWYNNVLSFGMYYQIGN